MKKFIYILFLQLGLLSANGQILSSYHHYKTKTTNNGLVFVNGTPISPPYFFELKDSNVYVNDIKLYQYTFSYDKFGKYYNELPSLPVGLNKNTDIRELINAIPGINSYLEESYIIKVKKYYYSHFEFDSAKAKVFDLIRKLPNVKEVRVDIDSYLIRPYNGESFFLDMGSDFWKEYNQKYYHKNDINKDHKKKEFNFFKEFIEFDFERLDSEENVLMFFEHPFDEKNYSISLFEDMVDICSKNISQNEKIELLIKKQIINNDTIKARQIIENYQSQLYINKYIERVKKEGKNNQNIHYPSSPSIHPNTKPCKDKSSLNSPYGNTFYAACTVPDNTPYSLNFMQEISHIQSNIAGQDFNAPFYYQDNAWDDNGYGNLTYDILKNLLSSGSFIFLSSHGNLEGIGLIFFKDKQCIKDWLGYPNASDEEILQNQKIKIKLSDNISWQNNTKPYVAVATPEWFNANWSCNIDNNKEIAILSACESFQSGCVQACTNGNGGVIFGYKQSPNYYDSDGNNDKLLKRMNGIKDNGSLRTAFSAFNNTSYYAGFSMFPTNAQNTLCPSPTSYTTNVTDNDDDAYFELDTYCDATQNANLALVPTIESGSVQIENREWIDVTNGMSNKIKFHYSTNSNFKVRMNVNPDYIRSYSTTGEYHRLDFDKTTPIEPTNFYYFQKDPFYDEMGVSDFPNLTTLGGYDYGVLGRFGHHQGFIYTDDEDIDNDKENGYSNKRKCSHVYKGNFNELLCCAYGLNNIMENVNKVNSRIYFSKVDNCYNPF